MTNTANSGWGDDQTRYFFELTPERVLEAVESAGFQCTGRCIALNSFENRVYDVELETEDGKKPENPSANRRVVKFYRPGRWTREQIFEEHQFIADLVAAEVPAIAPLQFPDGETLKQTATGIWYTLFPKVGGRAPDELKPEQLEWIGRLLGRMHNVGSAQPAPHRVTLNPAVYGLGNLQFLISEGFIPLEFQTRYKNVVEKICETVTPWFEATPMIRVHGDCHLGNLLMGYVGGAPSPFFLDFDDMVNAPAVQDLWLILPGRPTDFESKQQLESLLEGYSEMRVFDRATLKLIEPLRALRFVHYTSWIARRWKDPAFPLAFPHFGSHQYWSDETDDLERQLSLITQLE